MPEAALIAIIDDDEGMRVSLDGLLRSMGLRTTLYSNAEGFLNSESFSATDCIICDVHMPGGMSGLDLAHKLSSSRSPTPIILMSGFSDHECREALRRSQIRHLLAKPFDDETLIACLDEALAA